MQNVATISGCPCQECLYVSAISRSALRLIEFCMLADRKYSQQTGDHKSATYMMKSVDLRLGTPCHVGTSATAVGTVKNSVCIYILWMRVLVHVRVSSLVWGSLDRGWRPCQSAKITSPNFGTVIFLSTMTKRKTESQFPDNRNRLSDCTLSIIFWVDYDRHPRWAKVAKKKSLS